MQHHAENLIVALIAWQGLRQNAVDGIGLQKQAPRGSTATMWSQVDAFFHIGQWVADDLI